MSEHEYRNALAKVLAEIAALGAGLALGAG